MKVLLWGSGVLLSLACAAGSESSEPREPSRAPAPPASCAPAPESTPQMNGSLEGFMTQTCDQSPQADGGRFDDWVRDDAFAGYSGDAAALDRFWCKLDATLSADPNHAAALSWRGGLYNYLSGFAYRAGDLAEGSRLQALGAADLKRSLAIAPDDVGVRIQHMMSTLATLPYASGEDRKRQLAEAQSDLDYRLANLPDDLSQHSRGELWAVQVQLEHFRALDAAGSQHAAQQAQLREVLDSAHRDLAGSPYAAAAECWSQGYTETQIGCIGCHD